jgi:hypothetical protein
MKEMKILINLVLLSCMVLSCNQKQGTAPFVNHGNGQNAKLRILYFHPSMRCTACNAVEESTIKVLQEYYASEIEKGIIHFASYNMEEDVNQALVEKYEISFSSLLFIRKEGKSEVKTDFTEKAFQYALAKPGKYSELLKAEISKNLKINN